MTLARDYSELDVYKRAMETAIDIFKITRGFPAEEKFSLTDQLRRSSRSVCANIAEAWRKRRYKAAFIHKLSDAEGEAAETRVWLEFGNRCGYLDDAEYQKLDDSYDRILGQLSRMNEGADQWTLHA